MKIDYRITSVLVFDDVRFEASGKEILIGVYDNMLVPQFPYVASQLIFRVGVRVDELPTERLVSHFRLVDPNGNFVLTGDANPRPSALAFVTGWKQAPITFDVPGTYRFFFGINRDPEDIFQFDVLPQQPGSNPTS